MSDQAEADEARVLAATAKLAGPRKVWALTWAGVYHYGHGARLFGTRELALKNFERYLHEDFGADSFETMDEDDLAPYAERLKEMTATNQTETPAYSYALSETVIHDT
jgi:hypothetical protein